jgi:hypothetical protein
VDVCVVSCSLGAAVLLTVGCRQFLGIVEAGTWFRYLKIKYTKRHMFTILNVDEIKN